MRRITKGLGLGILLGLGACQGGSPGDAPRPPGRVDVAKTKVQKSVVNLAAFCDVQPEAGASGPTFVLPPLSSPAQKPPATEGWKWINLWATWCKPCIEEIPLMTNWRTKLAAKGHRLRIIYVSVDETDEEVAAYKKENTWLDSDLRVKDLDSLTPWLQEIGLDKSAAIPIHIFVNPEGQTQCVRAGGIDSHHFETIDAILSGRG